MGNVSLISTDECDACNQAFGKSFEDHFARLTHLLRTFLRIRGKRGYPKYAPQDKSYEISYDSTSNFLSLTENAEARFVTEDLINKTLNVSVKCPTHIPLEVYRCLVKAGYSLLPDAELPNFEEAAQME